MPMPTTTPNYLSNTGESMPNRPMVVRDLTQAEFQRWAEEQVGRMLKTLQEKGLQYSSMDSPALDNFFAGSAIMELSPQQYLMTLACKHWHSIARWSSGQRAMDNQEVFSKSTDIIIYMLLLQFMIDTDQIG